MYGEHRRVSEKTKHLKGEVIYERPHLVPKEPEQSLQELPVEIPADTPEDTQGRILAPAYFAVDKDGRTVVRKKKV
jgi:hypothetical protein